MSRLFWIYLIAGYLVGCIDATPYDGWIMIAALITFICVVLIGVENIISGAKRKDRNNPSVVEHAGHGSSVLPPAGLKSTD